MVMVREILFVDNNLKKTNIMKFISKLFFTVFLMLECVMASASNRSFELVQSQNPVVQDKRKTVKILCFGNSLTQDSFGYIPFILKNVAPDVDVTIGIAYISGCTLQQHLANFLDKDTVLDGRTYSPKNYLFYKNVNAEPWSYISCDVSSILADEEWDIVTFQQNSGYSVRDYDRYHKPYINTLHELLLTELGRDVEIAWNLIHGANSASASTLLDNWCKVVENAKSVTENTNTTIVFPYGTAVQNLRTLYFIDDVGDTGFLLADGGHLQDGLGCLCAAYANTLALLKAIGINNVNIVGDNTRIDLSFVLKNKIPGTNLGESRTVVGINELNVYMAQVAAVKAVENPYQVTDLFEYVPDYRLKVSSAGYATMYLDFTAIIPSDVQVYTASRVEGCMLMMEPVKGVVPANTGVIIKAEEGTYSFVPCKEVLEAIDDNLLSGTVADTIIKPADGTVAYVLSYVDGVIGMYTAGLNSDGAFKNNANKAYLILDESVSDTQNMSNRYSLNFSGTTSVSDTVDSAESPRRVYYTLDGQCVNNPVHGIYIVNGNKVLVK